MYSRRRRNREHSSSHLRGKARSFLNLAKSAMGASSTKSVSSRSERSVSSAHASGISRRLRSKNFGRVVKRVCAGKPSIRKQAENIEMLRIRNALAYFQAPDHRLECAQAVEVEAFREQDFLDEVRLEWRRLKRDRGAGTTAADRVDPDGTVNGWARQPVALSLLDAIWNVTVYWDRKGRCCSCEPKAGPRILLSTGNAYLKKGKETWYHLLA